MVPAICILIGFLNNVNFRKGLKCKPVNTKVSQLEGTPWQSIFDNFKNMINKILKSLRVAQLNPVTLNKNGIDQEAIRSIFHDAPVQGGHIRRHYKILGQGCKTLFLEVYVKEQ